MWELDCEESWAPKNAFELWGWRRLLRVPWTARRSNQSILKEISPECSLEEIMLKLKLQYFGHLMRRADSFDKTLMLGKTGGGEGDDRGWDGWMASPTRWTWVWVDSGSWWWTGRPGVLRFMGSQRVGHDWKTELTELKGFLIFAGSFGPVQNMHKTFSPCQKVFDICHIWSCPKSFGINQIYPWSFLIGINLKDLLAWIKCLLNQMSYGHFGQNQMSFKDIPTTYENGCIIALLHGWGSWYWRLGCKPGCEWFITQVL